jgi:hypothetical protein
LHHGPYQAPSVLAENHDRQLAAFQILLMRKISVRREQHVKSGFLSRLEQFAVAQSVPSLCSCFLDGVASQGTGDASWRSMVKKNNH